jgi:tetratricopeptide (TPR) repeat protein
MQRGSLMKAERKNGPDVWQFRWSEKGGDGSRVYRKRVIGTIQQYSDGAEANYGRASGIQSLMTTKSGTKREYAACLLAEGEAVRSVDLYRQLMEESPNTQTRMQFALALWKAKQLDEALATLSPLLEVGSANAHAFALAAQTAEEKGATPQAIQWLRQAIVLDPRR